MPAMRTILIATLLTLAASAAHALGAGGPAAMAHDGSAVRDGKSGLSPSPFRNPRKGSSTAASSSRDGAVKRRAPE